ncbi:hypothetical protein [Klebsiella aerogenes]|uniref:hypothetical protein n=1 Tax=Klebsiella aerogenes TaxID=548 RepID=UPI0007B3823F|nr:hypothetical protein [Klebsiella aerogenes]HDS6516642.1 hypothetical protein [Klebsiella oxytoca]EMA4695189.1 hypothetical protein [Klebsiella aerogenes]KZQ43960.1 hypothetical protein A3N58_16095 [Klebsiella aerogenes]WVJ31528.1 hypothetical protein V1231_04260 [Klebsiella aerogenes]HDT4989562.1 hypothetical protein [Klebsiella oxytoca]
MINVQVSFYSLRFKNYRQYNCDVENDDLIKNILLQICNNMGISFLDPIDTYSKEELGTILYSYVDDVEFAYLLNGIQNKEVISLEKLKSDFSKNIKA